MFQQRTDFSDPVTLSFEGREIMANRGDTLAAALLGCGIVLIPCQIELCRV